MPRPFISTVSLFLLALATPTASAAVTPVPHPKPHLAAAPVELPPPLDAQTSAMLSADVPEPEADMSPLPPPTPPKERPEARIGDSGLPVPRFVSLKSSEVYLREGPSSQHKVQWVYVRRGLPVEVIAEYDVWRRIRDADGVVGWVHKGMLDGKRSALMIGSGNVPLREAPGANSAIIAYAQPGVVARLESCDANYCEVQAQSIDAFVTRDRIWGVYATETIQ